MGKRVPVRNREDWRRMKGRMPGAADEGAGAGRGFFADGQKNPRTFEEGRGEKEEPSAPHGAHGDLWERDTSVCKPTTNRRRRVLAKGKAFVGGPDKNFYEEEEGSKERGSGKGKGCVGRVGLVSLCGSGFVSFSGAGPVSFCRFSLARRRIGGGNRRRLFGRGALRREEGRRKDVFWERS